MVGILTGNDWSGKGLRAQEFSIAWLVVAAHFQRACWVPVRVAEDVAPLWKTRTKWVYRETFHGSLAVVECTLLPCPLPDRRLRTVPEPRLQSTIRCCQTTERLSHHHPFVCFFVFWAQSIARGYIGALPESHCYLTWSAQNGIRYASFFQFPSTTVFSMWFFFTHNYLPVRALKESV